MKTPNITTAHINRRGGLSCAAVIEHASVISDSVLRVVARFNRKPTAEEIASCMSEHFSRLEIIPNSFYEVSSVNNFSFKVRGFLSTRDKIMSKYDIDDNFKEVASNVYIDNRDKSIWKLDGQHIICEGDDDITEIASLISKSIPLNQRNIADECLASVSDDFNGFNNTEVIHFLDVNTNTIQMGVRVGENEVFSEEAGLCEISQDLICYAHNLHGQDNLDSEEIAAAEDNKRVDGYDIDRTLDYYRKLFGDDPIFWEKLSNQIRAKAMA